MGEKYAEKVRVCRKCLKEFNVTAKHIIDHERTCDGART